MHSTSAWTRWPRSSSGRPITIAHSTSGCASIAASTSAGKTFAPALTIRSVMPSPLTSAMEGPPMSAGSVKEGSAEKLEPVERKI